MKRIAFLLIILSSPAFAGPKVITPIAAQPDYLTTQAIAGADENNNVVPLKLNASGNLLTVEEFGSITASRITISGNGATDRAQGANLTVRSCTFQALKSNSGAVYAGGSTVTNASGAAPGFPLSAGDGLGPITMSNLNQIYFSADTSNDKVAVFCN